MAETATATRHKERPRSPHLQIYRWPVTMLTSILHRMTGVAMGAGLVLVAWWLIATASGPSAYADFMSCAGSIPGRLVLFALSLSLIYHLLNGIRHLVWDVGAGFEKHSAERAGRLVIGLAVVLTLAIWAWAYHSMGAF
jgi:succinate dehydrogenase / fumarate reductase cytochrome b subunit